MSHNQPYKKDKILIIKLSALGDFVQALGPMAAIRKHHPDAHMTLMTTKMFKPFGERCGYFDDVIIDMRPKMHNISGLLSLRSTLIKGAFTRIYDLQNNDRTNMYFKLFAGAKRPEWVGVAKGASHRNTSADRIAGHAFDGHKQTLALAEVSGVEIDNLKWIDEDLSRFGLRAPYILFVPGSAPQHPQKRWPSDHYGALAKMLIQRGYHIVLLGTQAEKEVNDTIMTHCPNAINLTGQTSLFEIAALAHKAKAAIGNDTGPMHMIGPTGCKTITLFSGHSTPKHHAPLGKNVTTIQKENISDISIEDIMHALDKT